MLNREEADPYLRLQTQLHSPARAIDPSSGFKASVDQNRALELYNKNLYNLQNKIMLEANYEKPVVPELPLNTHESVRRIIGKGLDQYVSDGSYEHGLSTLPSSYMQARSPDPSNRYQKSIESGVFPNLNESLGRPPASNALKAQQRLESLKTIGSKRLSLGQPSAGLPNQSLSYINPVDYAEPSPAVMRTPGRTPEKGLGTLKTGGRRLARAGRVRNEVDSLNEIMAEAQRKIDSINNARKQLQHGLGAK